MNKRYIIGILALFLLTGGIFWYEKKVQHPGAVPTLSPNTSVDSADNQPKKDDTQVTQQSVPLPLTWERQKEVMMKSREYPYGEGHSVPDGISVLENQQAHEMEIARLNSLADGKEYPWHGWLGYYDGKTSYPDLVYSDLYKRILNIVQPNHYYYSTYFRLTPDGENLIQGPHYFELNFDSQSVCVTLDDRAKKRKAFSCSDWFSNDYKVHTIGAGYRIQIYGQETSSALDVSKMIIIEDSNPANFDVYLNNFQ